MIGQDCKQFECNIDKFVNVFLKSGEKVDDKSFEKMRNVITLYKKFRDIAEDIRAVKAKNDRISNFQARVESFFQSFKRYSMGRSTGKKPYLHILREHVADFMKFWAVLGWGYGYFSCNAGEHLNKCIKNLELHSTNLDHNRFLTIMRILRSKQFHFPESIYTPAESTVQCSSCKQVGHNKKNKNCPLHPDQPELYFSDSDSDD